MTPDEMLARLLYRDGLMLVVDKPPGIPVHRGPKGGNAFEDHFDALRFGLPRRPALAHRLDRDTSGCLVLGRHRKALAALGKLFKQGKVGKTYWAVVEGGPAEDDGTIDIALAKRDDSRGWWMKPDDNGLPSRTTWKVMGRFSSSSRATEPEARSRASSTRYGEGGPGPIASAPVASETSAVMGPRLRGDDKSLTWLALEPVTGRTHQLRVHCAAMGWPIVGDNIYGTAPRNSDSLGGPILHLLSREVVVPLSKNKDAVKVTAPVPPHMRERLALCGWQESQSTSS
jgi:tRNA pseudouridine32 synthase/23S rRNA pseudouridine746 synthase